MYFFFFSSYIFFCIFLFCSCIVSCTFLFSSFIFYTLLVLLSVFFCLPLVLFPLILYFFNFLHSISFSHLVFPSVFYFLLVLSIIFLHCSQKHHNYKINIIILYCVVSAPHSYFIFLIYIWFYNLLLAKNVLFVFSMLSVTVVASSSIMTSSFSILDPFGCCSFSFSSTLPFMPAYYLTIATCFLILFIVLLRRLGIKLATKNINI